MEGSFPPRKSYFETSSPGPYVKHGVSKSQLKWTVLLFVMVLAALASGLVYFLRTDIKDKSGKIIMKKLWIGAGIIIISAVAGGVVILTIQHSQSFLPSE